MAIPDYQSFILPILEFCGDEKEHTAKETYHYLAKRFDMSEEDQNEFLPSGRQSRFENRASWARHYLKHARLLDMPSRGTMKITQRGLELLQSKPSKITKEFLMQYEEFVDFQTRRNKKGKESDGTVSFDSLSPMEVFEESYQKLQLELIQDILENLHSVSPSRFEELVVEVLVKMGYGGTLKDAGKAVGKSGDGGIDGIINEDRLGLDVIYIQAKRWEGNVSRPEVQKFAGALMMKKAKKGIFITTSDYTKDACDYVTQIDHKIILINGEELAQYMIEYNLGVTTLSSYKIKRLDTDYFLEE